MGGKLILMPQGMEAPCWRDRNTAHQSLEKQRNWPFSSSIQKAIVCSRSDKPVLQAESWICQKIKLRTRKQLPLYKLLLILVNITLLMPLWVFREILLTSLKYSLTAVALIEFNIKTIQYLLLSPFLLRWENINQHFKFCTETCKGCCCCLIWTQYIAKNKWDGNWSQVSFIALWNSFGFLHVR